MITPTLAVTLGESRVGTLEYFEDDERYLFTFDKGWLEDPARPTLGQIFEDRRPRSFDFSGPPCWFSHLLPQGSLRRAIARAAGIGDREEFALYEILGDDLPGAVRMVPTDGARGRRAEWPRHELPDGGVTLAASLAGVMPKMSVRRDERGPVIAVRGAIGDWIAKFPSPGFPDLPRVEYATMSWARAVGIDVPRFELTREPILNLPEGLAAEGGEYFLIERFDRGRAGERIHQEDFAQILDRPLDDRIYDGRYEHIAHIVHSLCPRDIDELLARVVFCAICGNGDAHLKNWSLRYADARHARLSPAYDLVATVVYPPRDVRDALALQLGGSRRFEDVSVTAFENLARLCDRSFADVSTYVRACAERVRTYWAEHADELAYSAEERASIETHMRRIPLA